ncbi:MAG: ATP-binding protein [Erysipelotrichaceae bacterium]|jgi:hypothetical protein|nr:ATP-binding protein [Erysipelotrichaceae bacterium]
MVVLIAGSSHTGKTLLAQRLLEKYKYPYLSIDHLKMGLIRSDNTDLTIEDDDRLTEYLWKIVKEILKTAIENNQNLIIEGCYIPFYWKDDFEKSYLKQIKYICLIMTEKYIDTNYNNIKLYENVIEDRKYPGDIDIEELKQENKNNLELCKKYGNDYILIHDEYDVDLIL